MSVSSEIDQFLSTCENLVSQAKVSIESPQDFEKVIQKLAEEIDENWEKFSGSITVVSNQKDLSENLKVRLNNVVELMKILEDKANTKNNWVNEFKRYIIDSNELA